jgi:hypothetical protein
VEFLFLSLDNYINLVSSCEEFNSNHVSLFIRIQSARLVRRSCWASAAGPDFYGKLALWTADGLLGESGEEKNCRMRKLQEKNEKSDDEMKWLKKARLFELPRRTYGWMVSHAAVPYADRLRGSRYRVYFSARDRDKRSRTGFFDFDLQHPEKILSISQSPILVPGRLGAFDDSGAMLSWITDHKNKKYFYYIGWNLGVTVPFRNAIGLAVLEGGGQTPRKVSEGPILDRDIHDPYFVSGPCVLVDGGIWRMWYLSCREWKLEAGKPKHWYHIRYAESADGIRWRKTGIVCIDFLTRSEYAISRPCVIKENNGYKMWYSHRGKNYRIGYAESSDGLYWTRKDNEAGITVSRSGWDSKMIEYPFVFDHQGRRYLLYNGNDYGKTGVGLAVLA